MSDIQDLKHYGIDVEENLIKELSEHLTKEIDKEIIDSIMVDVVAEEIKTTNRDRKIDSFTGDKEYVEMKKEDHPYYKKKKKS